MSKLIKEDIFTYINYDKNVEEGATFAVPNEIFGDFKDTLKYSYGKCAYAYSYYYLSMYLHLYAKYGSESNIDKFTASNIQRMLGISPNSKSMTSITKKNGDLDKLGYTSTVTDYPVSLLRLEMVLGQMEVSHYMYSDEKRDFPSRFSHSPNYTVKHPDKMYWRSIDSKLDSYYDGTMNEADNTHIIPLEMFLHALNIPDISIKGFYVYAYIIYMSDKAFRQEGWTVSHEFFSKFIDISDKTLKKIIKLLENHNFISIKRKKRENGIDLPNTYIPNLNPKRVAY